MSRKSGTGAFSECHEKEADMTTAVDPVREQAIEKNPTDRIGSQNQTESPAQQSGAAKSAPCAPDNGGCRLVNCYGEVYPSRYNVFIALKNNRLLVYNAITGKLNVGKVWGRSTYL